MLHPHVTLRRSSISGRGLFAKEKIPKGTILWRFRNDRVYTRSQYKKFSKRYRASLRKYGYVAKNGNLVYCTGISKYWNHSCEPNTAWFNEQMDIAIEDIAPGEELTYDYVKLGPGTMRKCNCGTKNCRGTIKMESGNSKVVRKLTALGREAGRNLFRVRQPLLKDEELLSLRESMKPRSKS